MSLQKILNEKKADFERKADTNKKEAYRRGIDAIKQSTILDTAKQVGAIAPDFNLNNALGKPVTLKDYLKKGKVILTWYRGGWCPYCNLTLRALQSEINTFKDLGANLIALTPELPDNSLSTTNKNNLEFEVLSDIKNEVANAYGIVFKLTDEVAKLYNEGFGLNTHNGDVTNELPLAATFIINTEGEIIYTFLDIDYRNRAKPSELIKFLQEN